MGDSGDSKSLNSADFSIVQAIADRFEAAWRAQQQPPSMHVYLSGVNGPMRVALVDEMVRIDRHFRKTLGLPERSHEDYRRELPELGSKPVTTPAQLGHAAPARIPQKIGKYLVVRSLGDGGQASVYQAIHPDLGKAVVIKMGHTKIEPNSPERDQLFAEGRILAELDDPGLARVYDVDVFEEFPLLVMEYVSGMNLKDYVAQHKLEPRAAARLVARVARAVSVMHRRGIVHQDLKPQNILIDESGSPRVIDFGLARVKSAWLEKSTGPEGVSGTIPYMAPEQARDDTSQITACSDVFALGAILYWMLTGKPPFDAPRPKDMPHREYFELLLQRAGACDFDRTALATAHVPRALGQICLKAMSASPADRYGTTDELARALEAFADPNVWGRRAAILAVLAAVAGIVTWKRWPKPPYIMPDGPLLTMLKYDEGKWTDAIQDTNLPVKEGDELRLVLNPPPDVHLTVVWLPDEGDSKALPEVPGLTTKTQLVYPSGDRMLRTRDIEPGTALILVCGSREKRIPREELTALWNKVGPWDALPPKSAYRVLPTQVIPAYISREIDVVPAHYSADTAVKNRLERLRLELMGRVDYFEGIAFSSAK